MNKVITEIQSEIESLKAAGKYKQSNILAGPMGPAVTLSDGREVINLCSNN